MQCAYFTVFCFLAVAVHSGIALKCWSCDSSTNRFCADPFNRTRVVLVDCDRERSYHPYGQASTFVCKKYKYMSNDNEVILRSCAAEAQPCSPSGYAANKELFCEVCKEDGCNGAFRQSSSIFAILMPVALWAIVAKYL